MKPLPNRDYVCPLTDAEAEALFSIYRGMSTADLARLRHTSETAVKRILGSAYKKLEVAGAISVVRNKRTVACVWIWRQFEAAKRIDERRRSGAA